MTPLFRATRQGNDVVFDDRAEFNKYVKTLPPGAPLEVIVRPCTAKRSLSQNAYYHGVVVKLISQYCGYKPMECHEALKAAFLMTTERDAEGKRLVRSTADLDPKEFGEYIEACRQEAAEMGIVIPDPGEVVI